MTGNSLLAAYTEIAKNDLFPVLGITASGVDQATALQYLNIGALRVMRLLRIDVKATFVFAAGTLEYSLKAGMSRRILEVSKVYVGESCIPRTSLDSSEGYYVSESELCFNSDWPDGLTVKVFGILGPAPIVASGAEITGIPEDCHLAIAQLAIRHACGSHEIEGAQLLKLQNIEAQALSVIGGSRVEDASNTVSLDLFNGNT